MRWVTLLCLLSFYPIFTTKRPEEDFDPLKYTIPIHSGHIEMTCTHCIVVNLLEGTGLLEIGRFTALSVFGIVAKLIVFYPNVGARSDSLIPACKVNP